MNFSLADFSSSGRPEGDQQDYPGIFHTWFVFSEKGAFQTAAAGWDKLK